MGTNLRETLTILLLCTIVATCGVILGYTLRLTQETSCPAGTYMVGSVCRQPIMDRE